MAWPNETSTASGTTPAGTPWRSARFNAPGATVQGNVYAPASVPDGAPVTLIYAAHGTGGSASMLDVESFVPVREALTDAGYVVVSASLGNTWANESAHANLAAIYAWCEGIWDVQDVLLIGQSQGGGVVTSAALRGTFPRVRALVGIAPALNFQWVSDYGDSGPTIRAAYDATAATFPAAIQGYGPFTGSPADYAGLHILFLASAGDSITPPAVNSHQFVASGFTEQAADYEYVEVSGEHLSADHYRAGKIAAFLADVLNPPDPIDGEPGELAGATQAATWTGTEWETVNPFVWTGTRWAAADGRWYSPAVP